MAAAAALAPGLAAVIALRELRRIEPRAARLSWDGAQWDLQIEGMVLRGALRCRAAFPGLLWLQFSAPAVGGPKRHLLLSRAAVGRRGWSLLRRRLTLLAG